MTDTDPLRGALIRARSVLISHGYCGFGPHGCGDPEIVNIDEALSRGNNEASLRCALDSARSEIVLAIAFLARDAFTDRAENTAQGLIWRLAKADAAAMAALALQPAAPAPFQRREPPRDALDRILIKAMGWHPSENGPSFDETRNSLRDQLYALALQPAAVAGADRAAVIEEAGKIIDPYAWTDPDDMSPTERFVRERQLPGRREEAISKAKEILAIAAPALDRAAVIEALEREFNTGDSSDYRALLRTKKAIASATQPAAPDDDWEERGAADELRKAVIEECARISDGFHCGNCGMDGKCGEAIRALASATQPAAHENLGSPEWERAIRAVNSPPQLTVPSVARVAIATMIQGIMANGLSIADEEISGTGPVSYAIADAILSSHEGKESGELQASDFERIFVDACDEIGCAHDKEALLQAIADMKSKERT